MSQSPSFDPADRPVADLLRRRLRESPAPVLMTGPRTLPAASLWTSARALVADLRAAGLQPGVPLLVRTGDLLLAAGAVVAGLTGGFPVHLGAAPCGRREPAGAVDELVRHGLAVGAGLVLVGAPPAPADDPADGGAPAATAPPDASLPDALLPDALLPDDDLPPWVARAGLTGLLHPDRVRPRAAAGPVRPADPGDPVPALLLTGPDGLPVVLGQHRVAAALQTWLEARFGPEWDPADPGCRPAGIAPVTEPWWWGDAVLTGLLADLVSAEVMLDVPAADTEPGPGSPGEPALPFLFPILSGDAR